MSIFDRWADKFRQLFLSAQPSAEVPSASPEAKARAEYVTAFETDTPDSYSYHTNHPDRENDPPSTPSQNGYYIWFLSDQAHQNTRNTLVRQVKEGGQKNPTPPEFWHSATIGYTVTKLPNEDRHIRTGKIVLYNEHASNRTRLFSADTTGNTEKRMFFMFIPRQHSEVMAAAKVSAEEATKILEDADNLVQDLNMRLCGQKFPNAVRYRVQNSQQGRG